MPKPLLLLTALVAASAQAQSLGSVCGKLVGSTQCVQAIVDKDYAKPDAKVCNDLIGDKVVDSFQRSGVQHVEPPPDPALAAGSQVRAEISAAADLIRAGDCRTAETRLRNLLRSLR
jgi:hypothetical protein